MTSSSVFKNYKDKANKITHTKEREREKKNEEAVIDSVIKKIFSLATKGAVR